MAQVLSPSPTDSPFGSRSLSRNTSQKSLVCRHSDPKAVVPPSTASAFAAAREPLEGKPAASIPSSAPSSPRIANRDQYASSQPSLTSTPSSSLSLDEGYCGGDDGDRIKFPTAPIDESLSKPPSAATMNPPPTPPLSTARRKTASMVDFDDMPEVPLRPNPSFISMGDDASVKREPSRQVDYLSYGWREEDIWSSWRHIVARRGKLENGERLENASWRTWAKTQRKLRTVSPETLNWMKDHDVTWLYGPLQTVRPVACNPDSPTARSRLSRADSFGMMKPILKRRTLSEAMLQRSLSNSTLVLQAVACITSQANSPGGADTPSSSRFREHVATPAPSPHESTDYFSSHSTSTSASLDSTTPGIEKRHIHFNNKVEQCIAVEKDGYDAEENYDAIEEKEDDSSDDGIIMMQTPNGKERKLNQTRSTPRGSFSYEQQQKPTIAMLPATTLKYRGDTPEPPERTETPRPSGWGSTGRKLVHSASAETLKPPRPSNNFLVDDDDDEDPDIGWQPSAYSPGGIPMDSYDEDDAELEARGMRRTPSGMFMPYEDDEDMGPEGAGLFGRVVDTVNTARDIAHVIWNVGWRR